MAIAIDTQGLTTVLDVTPSWQNIMLTGKHGIGKSQILTNYFKTKDMTVKTLFLGQMSDPGDLLGLPTKDEMTGRTTFMPPYWFPTDGKPIVLFLDELNRARPEILQTVMDLVLAAASSRHATTAKSISSPTSTRHWCRASTSTRSDPRRRSG